VIFIFSSVIRMLRTERTMSKSSKIPSPILMMFARSERRLSVSRVRLPMNVRRTNLALALLSLVAAAVHVEARAPSGQLEAGDHYVAMGSSFAAGPGVTTFVDSPPSRCSRSRDNYPQQLARSLGLALTDVSCGGATTQHLLAAWNELPPQLDALRSDTKLVTITIGGNDIGYISGLFRASCVASPGSKLCIGFAQRAASDKNAATEPEAAAWHALEARLDDVAQQVRQRAPLARLVFVDYLTILPNKKLCPATPLAPAAANAARAKAARLARITAQVAQRNGAAIIRASRFSTRHHACANAAWMNGFPIEGSPPNLVGYHPNLAGMTAVARAVEKVLR
jgi:lysophospholipase L1-like esterase